VMRSVVLSGARDVMGSVAELGRAVVVKNAVVSASDACAGWVSE
jgi:hypothetical protein